ncbi:MAG: hypothetical protein PF484_07350 [Bacteroidales bacterium]|jgi:hypothetical protein|nr:hypothetical protein [Bacteroidales bacterium]
MNRYYLTGYYGKERTIGISDIEKSINKYGFIIDFKMFSDFSISMIIEIEEFKVDTLFDELTSYMKMNEFENRSTDSKKECIILLNVTFTKGTGDLRIEIPAVPG